MSVKQWVADVFKVCKILNPPDSLVSRYAEDLQSGRLQAEFVQREILELAKAMGTWPSAQQQDTSSRTQSGPGPTGTSTWGPSTGRTAAGPSLISFTDQPPPEPTLEDEKNRLRAQIGFSSDGAAANASSVDEEQIKEYVSELYQKAVGRAPDPATFQYLVNNIKTGDFTLNQAELHVVHSKEAKEYRAEQQEKAKQWHDQLEEFIRILFKKYAKIEQPSPEEVEEHVQSLLDGSSDFDRKEAEFKLMAL